MKASDETKATANNHLDPDDETTMEATYAFEKDKWGLKGFRFDDTNPKIGDMRVGQCIREQLSKYLQID